MTSPDSAASADDLELVIQRVFDAPRDLVFETMIEAAHLQKWWGPKECEIHVARHEPQPGGTFHYRMRFPGGYEMWGRFLYRAIEPPKRIEFISGFADAAGNRVRSPMAPTWPLEMLITTTLEERDGKTELTLRSQPFNASPIECQTFKAGHESMRAGFGGMYDKYQDYLAAVKTQRGGG